MEMNQYEFNEQAEKFIESNDLDGLINIIKSQQPSFVYKYIGLKDSYKKNVFCMLYSQRLYFNILRNYDDQQERANVEFVGELKSCTTLTTDISKDLKNDLMCCFCGKTDMETLLWTHYANCYNGFRLKFEVVDYSKLYKVIYTNLKYKVEPKLYYDNQSTYNLIRFTKCKQWLGQNEYRIVVDKTNQGATLDRQKTYQECGLKLVGVEIGFNCSEDDKKEILQILSKQNISFDGIANFINNPQIDLQKCVDYELSEDEKKFYHATMCPME